MELIRISERKLKIMLTPTDMCHFELNTDIFGEDSAQMHRAFRLLFDEIRRQTDFDADDSRMSIQYFPSREGGCEMFISNLQGDGVETEPSAVTTAHAGPQKESMQLRPVKKGSGSFRKDCAYRFEALSHLLNACKRLKSIDLSCESAAYKDENGDYFLLLTLFATSPFSMPEELDFLVEYGRIENAAMLRLYIREHASLICASDAVRMLAQLA